MTFGKGLALALSLVAAVALGILIGPYVTDRDTVAKVMPDSADVDRPSPAKSKARASRAARPASGDAAEAESTRAAVSVFAPELHDRLKPILNRGTNMKLAAEGFENAEQFATIAHAAKNTGIPFVVLKHRVLNEGKTLAEAIEQSKPEMNSATEARQARADARSALADVRAEAEGSPTATSGEEASTASR
jgi:hypothetical protein